MCSHRPGPHFWLCASGLTLHCPECEESYIVTDRGRACRDCAGYVRLCDVCGEFYILLSKDLGLGPMRDHVCEPPYGGDFAREDWREVLAHLKRWETAFRPPRGGRSPHPEAWHDLNRARWVAERVAKWLGRLK